MKNLEEIYGAASNSETHFKEKKILFLGSESYDAPTITILQGLNDIGFKIYTIKKWNINSWFCNTIIDRPSSVKFDFILSNLHWGTRWQQYTTYDLLSYPKILIDGDDNRNWNTWQDKYAYYAQTYVHEPPDAVKEQEYAPYRWIEESTGFSPDVVFTSQKQFSDRNSNFLPFGIQKEYLTLNERKNTSERYIDFTHIQGPGRKRWITKHVLNCSQKVNLLPGRIFNSSIQGEKIIAREIEPYYHKEKAENNVIQGYFRWTLDSSYYQVLNNSKVLIYPGIGRYPFWDSKRPWESYACGCMVLLAKPTIDTSEYSPTEICHFSNYSTFFELVEKCRYLYKRPQELDKLRIETVQRAVKYFSHVAMARYFLYKIHQGGFSSL